MTLHGHLQKHGESHDWFTSVTDFKKGAKSVEDVCRRSNGFRGHKKLREVGAAIVARRGLLSRPEISFACLESIRECVLIYPARFKLLHCTSSYCDSGADPKAAYATRFRFQNSARRRLLGSTVPLRPLSWRSLTTIRISR